MAETEVRGVRFGVDFSFFLVVGLLGLFRDQGMLLMVLGCCGAHELGHLLAMLLVGQQVRGVMLYGGGMRITAGKGVGGWREVLVLLAGCGVNLLGAAVCYFLGGPGELTAVDLGLGLFNLLPVRHFDGGRVVEAVFGRCPRWLGWLALGLVGCVMVWAAVRGRGSLGLLVGLGCIVMEAAAG